MIIRPIKKTDLDDFERLISSSGLGITSLPKAKELIEKKIERSIEAFSKQISKPEKEQYIFVLENLETRKIGGTCTIFAKTSDHLNYFFQLKTSSLKNQTKTIPILKAKAYAKVPSELAGLYLHKDFQKTGSGKLLSLSRLLFIAAFKERFESSFFANIRGTITENGFVPFWEGIGRHFLDIAYPDFLKLREHDEQIAQEMMPKYPIYLELLPKEVQESVGMPHEQSKAALNMLENEGFQFINEIDLFDGGPRMMAKTSKIKTIKKSKLATIDSLTHEKIISEKFFLSNEKIDFRACSGKLSFKSKTSVCLNHEIADALKVKKGEIIRYV